MSRYRNHSAIDLVVVHYSATPDGQRVSALEIDKWHAKRGFKRDYAARLGEDAWGNPRYAMHQPHLRAIGYHFVVLANGAVESGRRLTETGAHAKGVNDRAIGVCLVGLGRFSLPQWTTLRALIESLQRDRERDGLPPLRVIGHREVPGANTHCPGFDVRDWIDGGMAPPPAHLLEES